MLLIRNLRFTKEPSKEELKDKIIKRLHTKNKDFSFKIHKKSIDSRKQTEYVYQVLVSIDNEFIYLEHKDVVKYSQDKIIFPKVKTNDKPIIIGYGPSGMFACIKLLDSNIKSIVFEKGKRIKDRVKDVENFINNGILNENSNIQFGEGGAGTFSDAKLTTRIKNKYIDYILDTLIKFGADPKIKTDAHPHIGSDEIRKIIERITNYLMENGIEFHFDEEVIDFNIVNNRIQSIKTNQNEYKSNYYILAIGHSAYNTVKRLYELNTYIEKKDIAVGFRVEHHQNFIDNNQYSNSNNDIKEASEYFLTYKDKYNVYSFCMCPGGYIIPSTSIKNHIVTNGMSNASRDSGFANSAILIQVPSELFGDDVLSGYKYIYDIEEKAYNHSKSYKALSQNISDYMENKTTPLLFESTYKHGTVLYDFNNLFTNEQNEIFKKAFKHFDTKIKGFINNGIMIGPETRSSSPIRIKRDEKCRSINIENLYPAGEGAGYGGGIMSCSLDGIRIADYIIEEYLR